MSSVKLLTMSRCMTIKLAPRPRFIGNKRSSPTMSTQLSERSSFLVFYSPCALSFPGGQEAVTPPLALLIVSKSASQVLNAHACNLKKLDFVLKNAPNQDIHNPEISPQNPPSHAQTGCVSVGCGENLTIKTLTNNQLFKRSPRSGESPAPTPKTLLHQNKVPKSRRRPCRRSRPVRRGAHCPGLPC